MRKVYYFLLVVLLGCISCEWQFMSEDDYEIETNYIDLNNCSYYNAPAGVECSHSKSNGICMYQMYGYCPYRFTTEKHCRKIRTLKGEKSNRFNLT